MKVERATIYRYEPMENGSFMVRLKGARIGWVQPSGKGWRAIDNFMVPVRGLFGTRTTAAARLAKAFETESER